MKKILSLSTLFLLFYISIAGQISNPYLAKITDHLIKKDDIFNRRFPEFTINGSFNYRDKVNWLSGFLGGEFWNLYEISGKKN